MIYTVTLNPCLDYIVHTDALRPGALCRTHGETLYPGGKGVNVSLVCAALGLPTRALGFIAGRTGALFAMLRYGTTPDIVCLAKAFGGGMPLGAFVSSKRIMDALQTAPVLGHITTFGGHPVCCAAGLAALDYLLGHRVVEQVEAKGALYESSLGDHPAVREIRRSGLLMAVELGSPEKLFRTMELFAEEGILSDWFLYCDTAFRISPPLTISEDEVRDSARIVRACLDRL